MNNEQDWQQKYQLFQQLQEQIEQISHHIGLLNQQNMDIDISKEALQDIEKTKQGTEILAPIANGIFVKSSLQDNQKLIVNVGAKVNVEKTIPEVIELLEKQKVEITKKILEAEVILQDLQQQAMKIYQEVEAAA
tara:strand:- start:506 stop:910 length:405 start_codon:yes stop_codon:yes gene_type:complete